MKLQIVPPRRGARWVRQGFGAFHRRPLAFSGLFASFMFLALLLLLLPKIGPLLLLASLPLLTLGFMIATEQAGQGRFPLPSVYFQPLRQDRSRRLALLTLGAIYAGATVLIVSFSEWVDGGKFLALQQALGSGNAEQDTINAMLADPRLHLGLLLRFGLAALLSLPFWHAPALVHWRGLNAPKALFVSAVACWRNKAAFVVYALAWAGVILLFALLANLLLALLGQPQWVALLAMPAALLFSTVFYVSLYFTFVDCFDFEERTEAPA